MIDFKEVQGKLIRHLEETIELVRMAKIPAETKSIVVTTQQIEDKEFINKIAAQIPVNGSYVYWFEVSDPVELLSQFSAKGKAIEYKIARDNKGIDSKYVYVGSCTKTKLGNRFKQHCGWGAAQTYSLQLRHWLGQTNLSFTFSYVKIENADVAAQIEDQLHKELKPLFGKPGSNNRITKN